VAAAAARQVQVLTQQLAGPWVEQTDPAGIPLHLHASADPSRRCAIVSRFDFDTAIKMNGALTVLVIAEGLDRQRDQ